MVFRRSALWGEYEPVAGEVSRSIVLWALKHQKRELFPVAYTSLVPHAVSNA
jgi:hypothetical protein